MHLQPLYAGCERYGGEVAEDLFRRGICLPSSSSLSAEDQLYVINQVRAAAGAKPLPELERGSSRRHLRSLTAMPRFEFHAVARHLNHHTRWVLRARSIRRYSPSPESSRSSCDLISVCRRNTGPTLLAGFCVFVPAKILVFHLLKLDRGWWRYVSIRDVTRLAAANFAGSAFGCVGLLLFAPQRDFRARSTSWIFWSASE